VNRRFSKVLKCLFLSLEEENQCEDFVSDEKFGRFREKQAHLIETMIGRFFPLEISEFHRKKKFFKFSFQAFS